MYVSPTVCMPVCLAKCLSVKCPSVCLSKYMTKCLSVQMSVQLSGQMSVCLFKCLSVCPNVSLSKSPSVQMSCKLNSLKDELILMKLSTDVVNNLRMCMKENNLCLKYSTGLVIHAATFCVWANRYIVDSCIVHMKVLPECHMES